MIFVYIIMCVLLKGSNSDLYSPEKEVGLSTVETSQLQFSQVFGEAPEPPGREDDDRLPVNLRLKHGKERVMWRGWMVGRRLVANFRESGRTLS